MLTGLVGALTSDVVPTYTEAFAGIILIAAINTAVQPVLIRLVVRFRAWLFPVVTFLLNAAAFLLADVLVPGWRINGVLQAGFLALVLTGVASFMGTLLSISDDGAWRRFALDPLRARYKRQDPLSTPGFAFLEIDGLSEPVLREAMERGYAPHLKAWRNPAPIRWAAGSATSPHRHPPARRGSCSARTTTSRRFAGTTRRSGASSSRIGRASGPPAGDTFVRRGIAGRWRGQPGNLFSGDAPDSLFTIATILQPAQANTGAYFFFYANFYNIARTIALFWPILSGNSSPRSGSSPATSGPGCGASASTR